MKMDFRKLSFLTILKTTEFRNYLKYSHKKGRKQVFIIVGLGNPTSQYAGTRHNIGFDVIHYVSEKYQIPLDFKKHKAICGKGYIEGQKVILAQPQTYMNLSGESVRELVDYYKIDPQEELIVIYDDISLDVGQLRIRGKGSAGGHNGIKSILSHFGEQVFPRIKVGVGDKPKGWDLADYVLGHFSKEEAEQVEKGIEQAAEAIKVMITEGINQAMNQYNKRK